MAIQEVYNAKFDLKELQENIGLFVTQIKKEEQQVLLKSQLKAMEKQGLISVIN